MSLLADLADLAAPVFHIDGQSPCSSIKWQRLLASFPTTTSAILMREHAMQGYMAAVRTLASWQSGLKADFQSSTFQAYTSSPALSAETFASSPVYCSTQHSTTQHDTAQKNVKCLCRQDGKEPHVPVVTKLTEFAHWRSEPKTPAPSPVCV